MRFSKKTFAFPALLFPADEFGRHTYAEEGEEDEAGAVNDVHDRAGLFAHDVFSLRREINSGDTMFTRKK